MRNVPQRTGIDRAEIEGFYIPEPMSGCWIWLGPDAGAGYGAIQINGKTFGAHRVVYEMEIGPIPEGLVIDHLCRNRICVNPSHLEPVTFGENVLRGNSPTAINARKVECKRGHAFDEENTMILSGGRRGCRICTRHASKLYARIRRAKIQAEKP